MVTQIRKIEIIQQLDLRNTIYNEIRQKALWAKEHNWGYFNYSLVPYLRTASKVELWTIINEIVFAEGYKRGPIERFWQTTGGEICFC